MPASEPAFGQVWRGASSSTLWMLVCPNGGAFGGWAVIYMGTDINGPESYWAARIKAGKPVIDSMALEVGEWERVE